MIWAPTPRCLPPRPAEWTTYPPRGFEGSLAPAPTAGRAKSRSHPQPLVYYAQLQVISSNVYICNLSKLTFVPFNQKAKFGSLQRCKIRPINQCCSCLFCFQRGGKDIPGKKKQHICHIENCGKVYGKTSHLRAHLRYINTRGATIWVPRDTDLDTVVTIQFTIRYVF